MGGRDVKDGLYEQFARVGKVAGHPKRLELLDLLCQGERSVDELARLADLKVTTASGQLKTLREARLVATRRDGKHIYYRVAGDSVCRLLQAVQQVAQAQLSEVGEAVRTHFEARDAVEPISSCELRRRIDAGENVTVVDVRPTSEYDAGHITGAVSIPLEELGDRLDELSDDVDVVAYCRGPYCVLAPEAVAQLHLAGRRARRLDVGFPEWRLAGLPTDAAAS